MGIHALLLIPLLLGGHGHHRRHRHHEGCGVERQPVKTLTDAEAGAVRLEAQSSTVEALVGLEAPAYSERRSRNDAEKTTYSLVADVIGFKLEEGDGDFHIVIAGESGATLVAEIPDPNCSSGSAVEKQIAHVRDSFVQQFGQPIPGVFRKLHKPVRVKIVGIGFFDRVHGQRGVAPNGIELHPVIAVEKAAEL